MADGNIFISYRRGADSNAAGRLYDRLERHFDRAHLFFDIDSIPLGVDFAQHIDGEVAKCDVQLVVIGPGWLAEMQRLQMPNDFVRIEIEAALKRPDIPVIPVLLEGVDMPRTGDLPESLRPLARRNALILNHAQFAQIVDGHLIEALRHAIMRETVPVAPAEADAAQVNPPDEKPDAGGASPFPPAADGRVADATIAESVGAEREGSAGALTQEPTDLPDRKTNSSDASSRLDEAARPEKVDADGDKRPLYRRILLWVLAILLLGSGWLAVDHYRTYGAFGSIPESMTFQGERLDLVGLGACGSGGTMPQNYGGFNDHSLRSCLKFCSIVGPCRGTTFVTSSRRCLVHSTEVTEVAAPGDGLYCYRLVKTGN